MFELPNIQGVFKGSLGGSNSGGPVAIECLEKILWADLSNWWRHHFSEIFGHWHLILFQLSMFEKILCDQNLHNTVS